MAQHPNYQPAPMGLPSLYNDNDNENYPYRLAVDPPMEKDDFIDIPLHVESEGKVDGSLDAIAVTEDYRKVINFNAWLKPHDSKVNDADIHLKLVRELTTETIEDLIESAELSEVEITRVTIDTTRYKN
ncbi:hypothetical protein D307_gp142 [Bacillus phage Bastille]|uniref:Uncharacterized protein n=1 Tax=Bacillus phage Bastille TaxID=57477 RepID=J9PLB1_9CAUD|nr:hypothetical protein D307_gp142 [Bacillus phage Bastille]AEQ34322.1 hypothetical protein [Bacillus phage Bastille]